ncbi:MAG: hypothetical protein II973_05700 [Spirochaetaceae bacterium]|nr:hypothetical protein [Spirochaetaceae bacterium]
MALFLSACGGGGGGGGSFSKVQSGDLHNNSGSGEWGIGSTTGAGLDGGSSDLTIGGSGNLLISQMAALDNVTNVRIELVINGVAQEPIIADTTTTTDVLPRITPEDTVTGTAYINLSDGTVRAAQLDATQTSTGKVLKFKVPYKYSCSNDNGTLASGTYYARDGIDLSAYTDSTIAGWFCQQDNSLHKGSFVTGVRGDITLAAVPEMTYSYDLTFGGYIPAGSTTPQTGVSNNPYLINYNGTEVNQQNQLYINISNYTCDASALTMICDKAGLFTITQQSSGFSFVVKLNQSIRRPDSRLNGNAKLTVTDPSTGLTKDIYVKISLPIGSKDSPDAVGDIIFSDGSASAYNETLSDAQKAAAVAVIVDATSKKGVGLNMTSGLNWCLASAQAYAIDTYSTNDSNGKTNTDQIAALSDYNETNYPTFYYCTSYSVSSFTSGWYLPAVSEIRNYLFNDIVISAFATLGLPSPAVYNGSERKILSSSQYSYTNINRTKVALRSSYTPTDKDDVSANIFIFAMRVFD